MVIPTPTNPRRSYLAASLFQQHAVVIQCAAIKRVLNVPAEMVDGVRTLTIR